MATATLTMLVAGPARAAVLSRPSVIAATQAKQIDDLKAQVHELRTIVTMVLSPVALLVAILAAGGALGIVYSVRDQRRISQLHELTVGSELSSQRRAEQTYASFFEQSQTTLALVNDTLALAKEASDRATHAMEIKARAQADEIEEAARRLMLRAFAARDFEVIIEDASYRDELYTLGSRLRELNIHFALQEIELPTYTRFVKAIDQFLRDETEEGIDALRLASQERLGGDLHRFVLYWLGYMLTTVGDYQDALGLFRDDELGLDEDDHERLELEHVIAGTEFFRRAKPRERETKPNTATTDERGPQARFGAIATVLDDLARLATRISTAEDYQHQTRLSHEVARTRADILAWVAFDPEHLDDPLKDEKAADRAVAKFPLPVLDKAQGFHGEPPQKAPSMAEARESETWKALQPDEVRAWALSHARDICEVERKRDFHVTFALAECHFKLGDKAAADAGFALAEQKLAAEYGEHREKRRAAAFEESALISHSRLMALRAGDENARQDQERQARLAYRHALEVVKEMREGRVTVFSQMQRRNVSQGEFTDELKAIVMQEGLGDEVAED